MLIFSALLALSFSATNSQAGEFSVKEIPSGQTRIYAFDFNTEDISQGKLHGRYRYEMQVTFRLPQNRIKTETMDIHDDMSGVDSTMSHLVFSETSPWIQMSVDLFELDQLGRATRNLKHESFSNDSNSSMFPDQLPFSKIPLITLWKRGEVNAQEVIDTQSGHKLLFNFEAKSLTYLGVNPLENGNYQATILLVPASELVNAKIKIIDTGTKGQSNDYSMLAFANEGKPNFSGNCQQPGEIFALPPLILGDSTPLNEIELCYPTKSPPLNFQKIVLPIHKLGNDPNTGLAVSTVLKRGGRKAKNPLTKLSSSEMGEVNCHGYSLLSTLGQKRMALPEGATWIEGGVFRENYKFAEGSTGLFASSTGISRGTYPLQAILNANFNLVMDFVPDEQEPATLKKHMSDSHLRAGDIIELINGSEYTHSGVLIREPGTKEFWVQSKIAEGAVVETPLRNLLDAYSAAKAEIYRLK
jgi:hypothetical protein